MGFFANLLSFFGVTVEYEANCQANTTIPQAPQMTKSQEVATQQVPVKVARTVTHQQASVVESAQVSTPVQPVLIKEPEDLGMPGLPRLEDVPWLDDELKVSAALKALRCNDEEDFAYYWNRYYVKKKRIEEIVFEQEQDQYDRIWYKIRACWEKLRQPLWKAYVAGHFPDPQSVKGKPELAREVCVLDVEELKSWQVENLVEDGVYVLGTLQNCLFNSRWRPMDLNDRDKWYFRKVLVQYGLDVPPSNEPDPIPFEELYIGAVFGFDVTPEKRLSSYGFIRGDEPLKDRVERIKDSWFFGDWIEAYEKVVFFLRSDYHEGLMAEMAVGNARRNLQVRKILAGGNYPEVRSAVVEGVDLDELEKIRVDDLEMPARAKEVMQCCLRWHYDGRKDLTLADVVKRYHYGWLLYERGSAAVEAREYLYRHNYVMRPEDMLMDERTPIAYLELPIRIWDSLRRYESFETADDLVRCLANNDPVFFPLRDADGIGKKSIEVIRTRLIELGLLRDSQ